MTPAMFPTAAVDRRPGSGPVARWLVAVIVIAAAPAARTIAITSSERAVGVALMLATVVAALAPRSAWSPAPQVQRVVVLVPLAGVLWLGGRVVGVIAALGVVAWALAAVAVERGAVRVPVVDVPITVLVGPAVIATVTARPVAASAAPIAATMLGVLVAGVLLARPHGVVSVLDRVDAGFRWLVGALIRSVFLVLGLLVVVLPWMLDRLFGWDPLRPAGAIGWVRRPTPSTGRGIVGPPRRCAPQVRGVRRVHRAARRFAGSALVVAVVAVVAVTVARAEFTDVDPAVLETPSMASAPWWPEYVDALEQVRGRLRLNSFVGYDLPDVSSRYINIAGGRRTTWSPPQGTGACRPLRIWMFGGSTLFGEGQRDDHTIPSELARAAAADGLHLDVTNYGALGDTNWIEARRLEVALASDAERPDLVVFYDGINEFEARRTLNDDGGVADQFAVSYVDTGLAPVVGAWRRLQDLLNPATDITVATTVPARLDGDEVGALMARQYGASVGESRRLLASLGIEGRWYEQPTLYSRSAAVEGEPEVGASERAFADAAFARFRDQRPDGVVDLTAAMDATSTPVYRDSSHTNELGAGTVAAAMYRDLLPALPSDCNGGGS